jgi:hypothetical protein
MGKNQYRFRRIEQEHKKDHKIDSRKRKFLVGKKQFSKDGEECSMKPFLFYTLFIFILGLFFFIGQKTCRRLSQECCFVCRG